MRVVSMVGLKEKLSYYLNLIKAGEEVVVTSHRHRVARILPVTTPATEIVKPTRSVRDLQKLKGVKLKQVVSRVTALLDDRRRR